MSAGAATESERDAGESAAAPDPPRAIGSGEAQTRAGLAAEPVRTRRRPHVLDASLSSIKGISEKLASSAADLGLETLADLLEHVPHSHRDRAEATPISELKIGAQATVVAEVRTAGRARPTRRRT